MDIIRKYEDRLAYWVSEEDSGQSEAINKGFRRATGEILASIRWMTYLTGAFQKAVDRLNDDYDLVYGSAWFIDEQGVKIEPYRGIPLPQGTNRFKYWQGWNILQPTVFFKRSLIEKYGLIDASLQYALDYEFFIRLSKHVKFECMDEFLACYRIHPSSKTGDWEKNKWKFYRECHKVNLKYATPLQFSNWYLWMSFAKYLLKTHFKEFRKHS